jgi:trk system potassium uptake protein TrkA
MAKHKKEFAVIGLGRFGSALALTLEGHGHYVLGIDGNMDIVQGLSSQLTHVVALDATDDESLMSIDITQFETVVVAIGTDFESNLLITVALKALGVKQVICKTISRRQSDILYRIGADRVVLPEMDAGSQLAEELINPTLMERFHLGPDYSIADFALPVQFANQTLADSNIRQDHGINVLVVKRGKEITTSPVADFKLLLNDELVVLAKNERIEAFSEL